MVRSFLVLVVLLLVGASALQAQSLDSDLNRRAATSAYYSYSKPGDVTILVSVWGSVKFPGLYEVAQETKLSALFSLAGGPAIGQRDRREDRVIEVSLSRLQGGLREVVYTATMENEIFASAEDLSLQSGDVLLVDVTIRRRFTWRDVAPIFAAVGTIALAIDRLLR